MHSSVLRAFRAVSVSTLAFVAFGLSAGSAFARQATDCVTGANHVTAATINLFEAIGFAATPASPSCPLCGVQVTATATGMSSGQLSILGANSQYVATNGVSGTFTVASGVSAEQLNGLLSKTCLDAAVTVNAAGMTNLQLDALVANIARIDTITNLAAGKTLTLAAAAAGGKIISGAGTVAITSDALGTSADLTQITTAGLTFPTSAPFLSIDTGGLLSLYPERASGYTIEGTGTVSLVGTVDFDVTIKDISATVSLDADGVTGTSIALGKTFTLTAAQANGQTIAGTGTTSVFGNIAANANFTLIASLLNIPGSVDAGATATLTAAQGDGRTLTGAGTTSITTAALTANTNFRGLTTAGFAFSGSIASGATLSINAAQHGITVSGLGTVDILGTAGDDNVTAANITAVRTISTLAGADSLAGGATADTLNGGSGDDTLAGAAGIDTAVYAGSCVGAISGSSTLAITTAEDGTDGVTGVERLTFSDANILVVNRAGSEYATLDQVLALGGSDKLFGTFTVTSASFTDAASLDALIARFVAGSTVSVDALGMNAGQLSAVAANTASFQPIAYPPVQVVSGTTITGYFSTIQAGINFATAGDVVNVAAGTYAESLDVTKSLTLRGANAGINPNTGVRGAETVIQSALASSDAANRAFQVRSGNQTVAIDGFKIVGGYPLHDGNEGGFPRTSDVTFSNNIAEGCNAIFSGTATSWDEVVVSNNRFTNSNATALTSAMQLQTQRVATVSGNVITNAAYAAILLDAVDSASVTGNTINGTTVQAIQLANVNGPMGSSTIDGNTISNANSSLGADRGAIRLYGSGLSGTTTITNNTISASHNGIAIRNGENIAGKVINLSGNTITVGTGSSVYHGGTGELNFTGANTVNGVLVSTASAGDLFAVSATVSDAMDVAGKGLVRLKAANLYVNAGGNIGRGVTAASIGDTVNVEAGSYTENVTLDKRVALVGAGSGETGTVLGSSTTATPVISVTGSGLDAANQLVIKDVRVTGAANASGSDGIAVYGDTPVSYVKVDGVHVTGHGQGVHYRTGTISNVTVANSTFNANNFGVRVATAVASMDGMTIDGCSMTEQTSSAITTNPDGSQTAVNTNFTVSNSIFTNNSRAGVANQHDLSFFGFRGNATLSNVTVTSGNGTTANSNSYGIVFTNGSGRAALGTVSLSNVTVQGHVGKGALSFQLYNELSGVSMSNVSLQGCVAPWGDLIVDSTDADAVNAGNTALKSVVLWNAGGVNAEGVSFYTAAGSLLDRAVLADNFQMANQSVDGVDAPGLGLVRIAADRIYVTTASFAAPATLAGAMERAIAVSRTGDTIVVQDGVPVVLTAEITKSVTFDGNFTVNAASLPDSASATAILSSFMARTGASPVSANMLGMTANQIAAVNANLAGFAAFSNNPVAVVRGGSTVGYYTTIQAGINAATTGDTVTVVAGTFAENLSLSKVITLQGAGSGDTGATIVSSAASLVPVIDVTVGGTVANRVIVKDMRLTGGFGGVNDNRASGLQVITGPATERSHYTFDNLTLVDNQGHGILFNSSALSSVSDDIVVTNCRFIRNSSGFRTGSLGTVTNVSVTGSTFTDNTVFGLTLNTSSAGAASFFGDNVTIENCAFNGNGSASFGQSGTGYGDVALLGFQGDATIRNVTITGRDAATAAHRGLQLRGQTPVSASGNIVIDNVTITGAYRVPGAAAAVPGTHGLAMIIRNFSDASGISLNNLVINNTVAGNGLVLEAVGGGLNLGNTSFGVPSSTQHAANDVAYSVVNAGTGAVNATGAAFAGLDRAVAADNFSIGRRVYDIVDAAGLGLVRTTAANVFVHSGGSVARGVGAASASDTVRVEAGAYTDGAVTVNTTGLTIDSDAGVSGYSLTLGTADAVVLAGAGDVNVLGNANANSVTTSAGANAVDGAAGIDTAVFAGSAPASLVAGSTISVGADSVTRVEKLVFADATIALVGTGGSEYATLNAALAATTTERLFGTLAINSATFATAAELDAITARFVGGSTVSVDVLGMNATQLSAVAGNATASGVVVYPPVQVVSGTTITGYFSTIQSAINSASTAAGSTVNVAAGTYAEAVTVSKSLTLRGPNAGKAGTDATRGAEAVIMAPAGMVASYGDTAYIVTIPTGVSGVVLDGLMVNGDNPATTSPFTANGANPDADEAVSITGDGAIVRNCVIKNVFQFGVTMGATGAGDARFGEVTDNLIENVPYWAAVLAYDDYYAAIEGNTIVNAWRGVQTNNHYKAVPAGKTATISDNAITTGVQAITGDATYSDYDGILHNLQYGVASWTIANNTVTNTSASNTNADSDGIEVWSIQTGATVSITGNVIAGFPNGYTLWNCPATAGVAVSGGSVSGAINGVVATNVDSYGDAASSSYTISGVAISASANGVLVDDNAANLNGSTVALSLSGGTVTGGATGLRVSGADASVPSLSATAFTGQSGDYIKLVGNAGAVDATSASFGGATGATATLAQNYDIEDKISHKLDDSALGLVRVKASNVFVAVGGNIGRGVTAAIAGDTVNVEAGTYSENVVVDKRITLDGAGSGADGTVVTAATAATSTVTVTGSGSADGRLVIQDLRVAGSTASGIMVGNSTAVEKLTFDNIHANGMTDGISIAGTAATSDVVISNSNLSSNLNNGLRVASATPSLDGLAVSNCTIGSNGWQGFSYNASGANNVGTNFSFTDCTFAANCTTNANSAGLHDLSFFGFKGNASLTNVTVTSNHTANGYGIVFTAQGLGFQPAGTIALNNVTVSGQVAKGALTFQFYSDISNVSMNNVSLQGCIAPWGDLIVQSTDADLFNAGNTALKSLVLWANGGADATGCSFYSTTGSLLDRAVLADNYTISNQVGDVIDAAGLGLARFAAGKIYVSAASAAGAFERAIGASVDGDVIFVQDGAATVLTTEITEAITFSGNFNFTSANIPTGAEATAVLSSFMSRKGSSTVTANVLGMNANQLAAVAANAAGFTGLTYPPVQVVSGASITGYFSTIQAAINFATAGDVVNVAAGTYAEDLIVAKALSLRGPNYGINPNTGTRVAEAIIVPASNNHGGPGATAGKLIQVLANDISVDGFILDGDNPAISGGFAYGDVDSNCARALHNQDSAGTSIHVSGIDMSHNIVRNFTTTGYYLLKTGTFPNSSGNYVRNNLFQKMRFRAVYAQGEYDVSITGNVMDQVHVGVAINSVGTTAATGFQPRISNNTINLTTFGGTSRHMGISVNHRYGTSVRMLVENNTITADASLVNIGEGLRITTMVFGGSTHATGNVVNCGGTLTTGLWLWNNDGQGETLVSGGSITNAKTNGVYLTDRDTAFLDPYSYSTGNYGTISGTAISTIAGGTSVNVHWNGLGSNLGPCVLTLQDTTVVGGLGTGMAMNGAKARVNFSGTSPASFDGALPAYIALSNAGATNPATDIDATAVSFGGATGATATRSENFTTASKITDKLDSATLGRVTVKSANLFVNGSNSVAAALAMVSAGETVNIAAATYTDGAVTVNTTGLTIDSDAGVAGYSLTLGTADALVLAGAGDVNVLGNANANSVTTSAGANAVDGAAGIDTAVFSGSAPASLVAGSTISVGADSVTRVEKLVFADATIALVGTGGSEYATLNAAIAATTTERLFGILAINSATFATAAELDAITARFVGGSTVSVDVLGMNATQLSAVAGNATASGVVVYPPVQVVSGASITGYFSTIQAGINFATAGDVVNVAAGTYPVSSAVTVSKAISLRGARYGVDARTRSGAESVINAAGTSGASGAGVIVSAGVTGAVVDGFTVTGASNGLAGIYLAQGSTGTTVSNNIVTGNNTGIMPNNGVAATPTVIERNLFSSNTAAGSTSSPAVYIDNGTVGGSVSGLVIRDNRFTNAVAEDFFAIVIDNEGTTLLSGITISGNAFESNTLGIMLVGVSDSTISGNTFAGDYAVEIYDGLLGSVPANTNLTISSNTFTSPTSAVRISDFGFGAYSGTLALAGNTFTGCTNAIINAGDPAVINATSNTFDGVLLDGATARADIFTIADKVTDSVDSGSYGDVVLRANNVYVSSANSIASGIAAAVAGNTVNVEAGAYTDGAVTVNTTGLTIDSDAGVSGYSLTLGTADAVVLAGAGDVNVLGNANANSVTTSAGANAVDGAAGIDTAVFSGSAPASLVAGSTISVGADSVTRVEKLVFADATIALVGTGGSEYANLNAALAATTTERLFGTLAINSATFATAAELDAITARFVGGSTVSVDVLGMNATQLSAVAGNATASGVVVYPPVQVVSGTTITGYFSTIQSAINSASTAAGSTVNVAAGTYAEAVTVSKSLTLRGPNAGKAGTDATRGAEAVIMAPAGMVASYGDTAYIVTIPTGVSGVVLDGLMVNGDNPATTSPFTANGANPDADEAVSITGDGAIVRNCVIKNVFQFGVTMGATGAGDARFGEVTDNLIENVPYWAAVLAYDDYYAAIEGNTIVNAWRGVQTNNHYKAVPAGKTATISDNAITTGVQAITGDATYSDYDGILHNLQYGVASWTIANNTVTNTSASNTNADSDGIEVWSIQTGATVSITGNVIAGFPNGYTLWNCPATAGVAVSGGSVSGAINGVVATNVDSYGDAASSSYTISGVAISASANGVLVDDNAANLNGSTVALSLSGGTVTGGATGLRVSGADASVPSLSATAFTGQSGDYIKLVGNAGAVDATSASFGGATGATATLAQNYDIEDKISHKLDDSALGLVRVKASNVFVAVGGNIGRGVTAASTGDTVNVEAGAYTENVTLDKRVTLVGAGSGETGTVLSSSTTATPVITVTGSGLDAANQLVIKDVRVTGAAPASASDGIAVYGDTPVSFVKVDGVHVTGHGQGVHYRTGTISNVTVANSTFNANNFGVRVATAVASMDGMTIDGCAMTEQTSSAISTNPSGSQTVVNTNFTVSNSTFTNNSRAGVANQHDLSFFGFRGNATLSNVTVTSGNGTTANSNSYGIVFTNGSGRAALGTVSLSNVTVQGHVGKGALSFQLYNELSGVSMSNVSLQGCVAPWGDLIVDSTDADAVNAGNTALKSVVLWNAGGVNAEGVSFYTAAGSLLDRAVLADNYTISNQVVDIVDAPAIGLVRFAAGKIYVSAASAAGAFERAIGASVDGDVIFVQDGAATVLTTEITKAITFSGNFTITSTNIPTGSTATAVLSSFYSRLAAGSTIAVNAAGMSTDQLAAVATVAPGSVTGVSITSANSASAIASLLAQTTGATVDMAGMSREQTAAVNVGLASVATVSNSTVRVTRGASVINYNLFVDDACAVANAGDTVNVDAGTYALLSKIEVDGYALVGAGMASVTIDMSAAPMSTTLGLREQGILLSGNGASVSGFTLTSPTRTASTGSAYGIKANDATGISITNVKVTNVALSAVDLNGTVGATISGLQVDGVATGYGLAVSGSASGIAVTDLTIANAAWGDAAAFAFNGAAPTGVTFGGVLSMSAVTIQPYATGLTGTVEAGNAYHSATAGVTVPSAFNRQIGLPSNGQTTTQILTRQATVAPIQSALVAAGVPLVAQTVTNILGPVETVRGGVALSGKSVLDTTVSGALVAGDVVQMNLFTTGGTVAMGDSAFPATSTIVGTFSLTSTSFTGSTALDSILAASGTASRTVVMTAMNATQVHAVALKVDTIGLGNISDALYAVNASTAADFDDAFAVSGITPDAAYAALSAGGRGSVRTDMVSNRGAGYASVAVADEFFNELVAFRGAQLAVIDGASLTADDFAIGARYPAVAAALAALPAGTLLDGETSAAYDAATVIGQFNALVVGGRGRTNSLNAMNTNDASISAMNTAFAAALETSQAYDALDAGLTSANSASNITYLLGFSAANATNANAAGMGADQLTSLSNGIGKINAISSLTLTDAQSATEITNLLSRATNALATATGMNAAKLSALGAGYASIAADGITGTLAIDVNVTDLGSLLSKTAVLATVNVDATGFGATGKGTLATQIGKVDLITNLALASSEDAAEIAALLTKATGATADATGMGTDQLNALSTGFASLAANGITGTFTIDAGITDVASLLSRTSADAVLSVNLAGMSTANIAAVNANLSLVDSMAGAPVSIVRGGATVGYQLTIQTGIDYAAIGDVVNVAAGTYTEQFNLTKAITVQGPNAGVAGTGTRGAEAVLDYSAASVASGQHVLVSAGALKGFRIQDNLVPTVAEVRIAVRIASSATASVENNVFFRDSGFDGPAGSVQRSSDPRAIHVDQTTGGSVTIAGNHFTGAATGVFGNRSWFRGIWTQGVASAVTVSNNVFDQVRSPMNVQDDMSMLSVAGNAFNGVGVTAMSFGNSGIAGFETPATVSASYTLGANTFTGTGTLFNLTAVPAGFRLDATASTFNGTAFSAMDLAGHMEVAVRSVQSITNAAKNGLVISKTANLYVPAFGAALTGGVGRAIAVATAGETVNVDAGTFAGNLNVDKRIALVGAGASSVISSTTASTPVITVSASGSSATDRLVVSNLTATGGTGGGNSGSGIYVSGAGAISHLTFDAVTVSGNTGFGIAFNNTFATSDVKILNSTVTTNTDVGIRIASATPSFTDLLVDGCTVSSNGTFGFVSNPSQTNTVVNTRFTIQNSTFSGNNTLLGANNHDMFFGSFRGDATISNVDITANQRAHGIVFNGWNNANLAEWQPIGNVVLNDVVFNGTIDKTCLYMYRYSTLAGVTMTDVDMSAVTTLPTWYQLTSDSLGTLNAGNTKLRTISSGGSAVDATNVVFYDSVGAIDKSSLANLYRIEDAIRHTVDIAAMGFVRVNANSVYLSKNSGTLENAILAASAGDVVYVEDGTAWTLVNEITKSITFSGNFTVTAANIPSGATASTVLNSFVTRGAVGSSTFSAITSGMSADQLNAVGTNYAYFNGGVTGDLTLTSAQSAAQISSILAGAADGSAYVVATGMADDQLNAVAAAATKVATDGITGTMIVTSGIADANLGALLGKASEAGAVVEVNASGMTDGELSTVVLAGARVDEAYNLSLDNGQSAGEITALLGKSVAAASTGKAMALADATTMDATKLNALGGSSTKLAADGITGSVALSSGVTDANFTNLFGKIALGADVRVDGTGLGASTITIVSANIAKVDTAFALFVTNAQSVTELGNVLGVSDASSATANATGMDSLAGGKLATLANNYTKFTASGISGTFTIGSGLTPTQIANLLSKVDFGTGGSSFLPPASITIDATGMSNEQLSTIATSVASAGSSANQAAVFDIVNLSLTDSQNATEMAVLLNSTLANEATVDATGMDASQLAALGNAPAAVDQITGTVTITADLTAAQIAAIMGNTATTAQVTIDSTGMSPEQQAAVLSTAVMVVGADTTVATGNLFTVDVDISGLSTAAVGVQARIGYDASRIEFVADVNGDGDTDSIGGTDMPTTIFVNPGIGSVSFATGVDTGGDGTGFTAGNAARLTFRALVPFCGATDLVWLVPSDATFTNRATTSAALPIPFTGTNFSNVTSLNNLQLAGVPGADTSVAADAGTTAGAAISEPTVTASNNCVPSVAVVRTITFPNATTSSIWPARFPVGVSTVTWTATDAGGNVATATRTYTVANYQLATIDVNLIGGINAGITFDQVVRIRLSSGDIVTATVPFTGNNGAVIDAQIPVRSDYTCITVKDAGHTVADAQTLSVSGTKYVASGSFQLISGDSNDDNVVDILDFGAFVSDRGAGKTPASRSNFDRNPVVNNSDFSFISLNFLVTGDTCGGGTFDGDAPLTRVSIKELRRAGLGHLEEADINMDGWLDQTDMALAMQGQYRKDFADRLDAADEVPMTEW